MRTCVEGTCTRSNDHEFHITRQLGRRAVTSENSNDGQGISVLKNLARHICEEPNVPLPLELIDDVKGPLIAYLYSHSNADGLESYLVDTVDTDSDETDTAKRGLDRLRQAVKGGQRITLDQVFGVEPLMFRGRPRKHGANHLHHDLFLNARSKIENGMAQETALETAAREISLSREIKNLAREYRNWDQTYLDKATIDGLIEELIGPVGE